MPAAVETGHAGLMDQVYRRQRYIYDFTRKCYLLGRDATIRDLRLAPGDRLIEIGCGTARNLIAIARRYPQARLFGLDASAQMLETAQIQVAKAGLADRITLRQGLAEDLTPGDFHQDGFDHALFSYSLSMIPDWRRALAAAANSLSQQGRIHAVDFGDLKGLPGPVEALLRRWLELFHVVPRNELLAALESQFTNVTQGLTLLPGRYAFRLSAGKVIWDGMSGCGTSDTDRG